MKMETQNAWDEVEQYLQKALGVIEAQRARLAVKAKRIVDEHTNGRIEAQEAERKVKSGKWQHYYLVPRVTEPEGGYLSILWGRQEQVVGKRTEHRTKPINIRRGSTRYSPSSLRVEASRLEIAAVLETEDRFADVRQEWKEFAVFKRKVKGWLLTLKNARNEKESADQGNDDDDAA